MLHRCFIAINLSAEIKRELKNFLLDFQQNNRYTAIKWVGQELLHSTLHFLGPITEEQIAVVKGILAEVVSQYPCQTFKIGQIGAFPALERPRVIFLKLEDSEAIKAFQSLQEELGQKLAQNGFILDNRLWQPHLTIGRVKAPIARLRLPQEPVPRLSFLIKTIDLMESELLPAGPCYSCSASCPLRCAFG